MNKKFIIIGIVSLVAILIIIAVGIKIHNDYIYTVKTGDIITQQDINNVIDINNTLSTDDAINTTALKDNETSNTSNSEFERAISSLKNTQSIKIHYEYTSKDTKSSYELSNKNNLIIDYKNNLVKEEQYYSYVSSIGGSDTSRISYWDISKKFWYCYGRDYSYDCDKWWYEDGEYNEIYSILEDVKNFTDEDVTKKVSNNYRIVNSKTSFDIGIENDRISYIYYTYSDSTKSSITQSYQIDFEDYNSEYVSIPDDVKNALSENEFVNLYGD